MVLVGDSGVGKTNILSRFVMDVFQVDSKTTIGVEFSSKCLRREIKQLRPKCGIQVRALYRSLAVAGQERYRAITSAYNLYASIHCVGIIVGLLVRSSYSI